MNQIHNHSRPYESKWRIRSQIDDNSYFFGINAPLTLREALLSDSYVLGSWKGEYEFDNYNITLYGQRGKDLNLKLIYGQNVKTIEADISIDETYTHMLPYLTANDSSTGSDKVYTLSEGDTFNPDTDGIVPYINADQFKDKRIKIVDYSSRFNTSNEQADPLEALKTMVSSDLTIRANRSDLITNIISISYMDLIANSEYSDIKDVDKLRVCDWIEMYYPPLSINMKIQITRTVYDVLQEKYIDLGLGNPKNLIGVKR